MKQIVLIEKYSPSCDLWPNLIRKSKIPELSAEQIIEKYQGFEGDLISFFSPHENKFLNLQKSSEYTSLYILSNNAELPYISDATSRIVGFDVGICDEEKSIYSSIFNEILFGNVSELVEYRSFLNENFLFPDFVAAKKYVALHDELSLQGKDVEDYEELKIYQINRINSLN